MGYIDRISQFRDDLSLVLDAVDPVDPDPDVKTITGPMPGGFTVPAGTTWEIVGTVETDGNVIVAGRLIMRGSGDMENPTVLRFIDIDEEAMIGGGMTPIESDPGLWPVGVGLLDFVGTKRTRWSSDGVIPDDWEASDEMYVCPHEPGDVSKDGLKPYKLGDPVPSSVLGDGSVQFTEIINLSCDVLVEGTPEGRTHITILSDAVQTLKWFCIRHTGPRQTVWRVDAEGEFLLDENGDKIVDSALSAPVPGRRALHFHMREDATRGSVVEGVLVRDSGGMGSFVPHKSHGILYEDCLAYNVNEHAFFWDNHAKGKFDHLSSRSEREAAERAFTTSNDIVWRRCGVVLLKPIPSHRGTGLSGFYLGRGTGNVVDDCFTAANQGGKRSSGLQWPSAVNDGPNVWTVEKFVDHNGRGVGIFTWQNTSEGPHIILGVISYNHGKSGILHGAYGASLYRYRPMITRTGHSGIVLHAVARSRVSAGGFRDDNYTLSFEGGYISKVDFAVAIVSHTQTPLRPTLIRNVPFTDIFKAAVVIDETRGPGWTDFVDCTLEGEPLEPDDVDIVALQGRKRVTRRHDPTDLQIPGSTVRIQNGDEAWQLNPDGLWVPIDPFYPLKDPDVLDYQAPGPVFEIPKEVS